MSTLAALALLGCSTASSEPGARVSAASAGNANSTSSGGATSVYGGAGAGNELIIDLDAGSTPDGAPDESCARLNIGIFGNPGANGSSNFEQWLAKAGTSVKRIQTTADEPVTPATLEPFDVIVLDCLARDYSSDEASSFAGWVTRGGGVAAMSGFHDDTTIDWHANSLLALLGVAFSGDRVWGPVTSFAPHAITQGLTSVTFTGGYTVLDIGGSSSTREPIAFIPGMPPKAVASAVEMGRGHAFVWGDEWIEFDSEWAALPEISQPLGWRRRIRAR